MRIASYLFFVFLFLFFSVPIQFVSAQSSTGVELKPSVIEEGVDPGGQISEVLSITNQSSVPQTYYLQAKDISGVDDAGTPIFADPGAEVTGFELSAWLVFPQEGFTLNPQESIQVPLQINVPQSATPGSHFGGIFVTVEPPRLREVGAGISFEVGAIISIRISGDAEEDARIREFSTDRMLYSKPDVTFVTRVENPGKVLIRPRGPLEINNMFGKRVGFLVVNDSQGGVFPGTTRRFETKWTGEGVAFGRYQAIAGLVYGQPGSQSTVSATLSFWILPLNIILPVLGVLSLIVLILYLGIKVYIRRTLDELSTTAGRRVVRRRRDNGISRLMVVAITLLLTTTLFLVGLLIFFA